MVGARWPPWSSKPVAGRAERAAVGSTPIHPRSDAVTGTSESAGRAYGEGMIDFIERDGRLSLSSAALRIEFDASHGRFSIGRPDAAPIIRNATARARFATLVLDTSALKVASSSHDSIESVHGPGEQLAIAFQPERDIQLTFHASLYHDYPFLALRLAVTNRSAQTHQIEQLTPLRTGPGSIRFGDVPAPLLFFKHGYQSCSSSATASLHCPNGECDTSHRCCRRRPKEPARRPWLARG